MEALGKSRASFLHTSVNPDKSAISSSNIFQLETLISTQYLIFLLTSGTVINVLQQICTSYIFLFTTMKRILKQLEQLSIKRDIDDPEYNDWIAQTDTLDFLENNARDDFLVIYANIDSVLINSLFVSECKLKPLPVNDLLKWDCNGYESWGIVETNNNPCVEHTFTYSESETLRFAEQIVYIREFNGVPEVGQYVEISHRFTQIFDIHYMRERRAWCNIDENGEINPVICISDEKDQSSIYKGLVVLVKREFFKQYASLTNSNLLRFFCSKRTSKYFMRWESYAGPNKRGNIFYNCEIQKNIASAFRGFQFIPCMDAKENTSNSLKDSYNKSNTEYPKFICFDWKNKKITKYSCSPDQLTYYPIKLSPVFFNSKVLLEYKNDSEKYKLTERSVICRGRDTWHLERYDINEEDQVHTNMIYLSRLPIKEQLHWLKYNEAPKASISERSKNEFLGIWHPEYNPLVSLKNKLKHSDLLFWNLKDKQFFDQVNYTLTDTKDEWSKDILNLYQLLIEGFDVKLKWLRQTAKNLNILSKDNLGSIELIKKILIRLSYEEHCANKIVEPFHVLRNHRNKLGAHLSVDDAKQLKSEAFENYGSLSKHFRQLVAECDRSMKVLIKAFNHIGTKFEDHIELKLVESGYKARKTESFRKDLCLISDDLIGFIKDTQPKQFEKLSNQYGVQTSEKIVKRISNEIEKRGLIDVIRKGVKDRGSNFRVVFFKPKSAFNPEHQELYKKNRFTVVRQLKYSVMNENSVDLALFVNGIPFSVLELKNSLTGQIHSDAEEQFKKDRSPKEPLFRFKRCLVFFAVGNEKVSMTTQLAGQKTKFLPYNKDIENPVNPEDHKSSYLWEEILQPDSVLDLVENYVHVREEVEKVYNPKSQNIVDNKSQVLIFPRYHQLRAVGKLIATVIEEGTGKSYLIRHTTGSGKSLSIGWLSHQLTSIYQNPKDANRMFDSVIVVTDRKILDKQIQNTIKQLEQTKDVVNPVDVNSQQLKEFIEAGMHIIITTIKNFPVISSTISKLTGRKFAVIVDEVHSSQSGQSADHLQMSLSNSVLDEYQEGEDIDDLTDIDKLIFKEMGTRGKQPHISYFGFSGTPENKTLEIFGRENQDGQFESFDVYSMKQSIAEGFTLDVLSNYTTYKRYFNLNQKEINDDKVDIRRVKRMLVNWVDIHPHTIAEKTKIILDHFNSHTVNEIDGKARAMVVTRSRLHCVKFKLEFDRQIKKLGLPYGAIVGFSGEVTDRDIGQSYTESSMNAFADSETEQRFKYPENRILIVNNKFQTGFDEPMLHSMYIDKRLGGLQAVQTLSRLNPTMHRKRNTFVLDFVNDPEKIQESFQPYYNGTILTEGTDPNHIYTLKQKIEERNLYNDHIIKKFTTTFCDNSIPNEKLQRILDSVVESWKKLEYDQQEDFRKNIQSFIRFYGYIIQIISFKDIELEKLYIFLIHLVKKLPRQWLDDIYDVTSSIDIEYFRIKERPSSPIDLEGHDGQ